MDDLEIFRNAFISSGIDIDKLIARAQQDDVKKKLIEDTTDAVSRGAFGSPTFFVGQEMFFGKDQLRDVEESIIEQAAAVASRSPEGIDQLGPKIAEPPPKVAARSSRPAARQ
jgi:hypothetical protein